MRLLWAAVCQNHLSLQCGKGRGPQSRFRVFIYSSYYQRGHDQRPPKTIPSLTTSTQQMILRREDSPRLQLQHSHLKSRRRHVSSCHSSRQRNLRRRLPPSSTLLADDSTNIVDIIITFASSLFLATQRSRTPVDNLDAVILPAAALPAAALHAAALPASALLADDGTIIVDTS